MFCIAKTVADTFGARGCDDPLVLARMKIFCLKIIDINSAFYRNNIFASSVLGKLSATVLKSICLKVPLNGLEIGILNIKRRAVHFLRILLLGQLILYFLLRTLHRWTLDICLHIADSITFLRNFESCVYLCIKFPKVCNMLYENEYVKGQVRGCYNC